MFMVVTGASASGKSAYAEQQILSLGGENRYYIATMLCRDAESEARIARHQKMRHGKGFQTVECQADIDRLYLPGDSTALLECMSNLVANEFFDGNIHTPQEVADKIIAGVVKLSKQCRHLVVVTNEVFSDGVQYDEATRQYLQCLGRINCAMAGYADRVTEVVCGIPVLLKEGGRDL